MQPGEKFVRCLLDQKDEEGRRARRLRRRTLLISILIQVLVLTLLLLRPLFGAEEVHLVARLVPLPPYRGGSARPAPAPHRPARPRAHQRDVVLRPILLFPSPRKHPVPAEGDTAPDIGPAIGIPGLPGPGNPAGLIPFSGMAGDSRPLPPPPPASEPKRSGPRRVPSEVQEAKLLERIEPQYPALARQAHLQGTVELHAIIARDGSIQSVEIVSGNVILATAARDAVMRWRYRPTLLNGQPVEVETFIHVVFKMP